MDQQIAGDDDARSVHVRPIMAGCGMVSQQRQRQTYPVQRIDTTKTLPAEACGLLCMAKIVSMSAKDDDSTDHEEQLHPKRRTSQPQVDGGSLPETGFLPDERGCMTDDDQKRSDGSCRLQGLNFPWPYRRRLDEVCFQCNFTLRFATEAHVIGLSSQPHRRSEK